MFAMMRSLLVRASSTDAVSAREGLARWCSGSTRLSRSHSVRHAGAYPDRGNTAMKVGFIGVGNMGGPMCRNIIRNTNHDVVVFDLNPAAIKACTDLGATAGTSVAQVASGCDVV